MTVTAMDALDVWIVDLQAVADDLARGNEQLLSHDETARAASYHFMKDRQAFVSRRSALRIILSKYAGRPPHELEFECNRWGKPELSGRDCPSPIAFNMSSARGLAVIAVGQNTRIGVDIEFDDPATDCLAIADRFFSTRESQVLHRLSGAARREMFLRLWTQKESLAKAIGRSVSSELDADVPNDRLLCSPPVRSSSQACRTSSSEPKKSKWWFEPLPLIPTGYFATVCTPNEGKISIRTHSPPWRSGLTK